MSARVACACGVRVWLKRARVACTCGVRVWRAREAYLCVIHSYFVVLIRL